MSWWKSQNSFTLRIFFIALVLRLIPVILTSNLGVGLDDMFQYDMLARSIAAGNGYRWYAQVDLPIVVPYLKLNLNSVDYDPRGVLTTFRPPFYPAFLALIYLIAGVGVKRFFIARLVQAVMAALLAPLTYALARSVFSNTPNISSVCIQQRVAITAAWVVTIYPMLVIYPLSLATEDLFFVLILCSCLVLLKAKENLGRKVTFWKKFSLFTSAGILIGMTCLTRSVAEIFAVFAVLWVWFFLKQRWMAIVVLVALGLVIFPWIVRNSLLDGRLIGIESSLGYDLYVGYHPDGTGTFQYPQSLDLMTIINDSKRDAVGWDKTWEFIKADPKRILYLVVRRAGYFFGLEKRALTYFYSNDYFGYVSKSWLIIIAFIFCLPFMIVSTTGVLGLTLVKWRAETWLMALLFIGYISPHLLIIAEDRFHLTLIPFLAIFSAFFWASGWHALEYRWQTLNGKIAIILAVLVIMLLFTNWGLELWRNMDKLKLLLSRNGNKMYFPY